jgi:tetratricopeptide (TPR) repeat protein
MTTRLSSRPAVAAPGGANDFRAATSASPAAILIQAEKRRRVDGVVIQDFRPLAESIEWELGQLYLRERGSKAFLSDPEPVPYRANNNGNLSSHAAAVLFASLQAAERAGELEPDILVLELGIGVGLFARFFLDAFQDLSRRHCKDYYERLCYVAADHSEAMLRDAERHGVFANHPGRYRLQAADAQSPEALLGREPRPFRAVFLNYLLDCLPAAVLDLGGAAPRQLAVRTRLSRGVELRHHTSASAGELAQWAASANLAQRRRLLDLYTLLAVDYGYLPVELDRVPHGDFAARAANRGGCRTLLHSYGAIDCLERLLGLVMDDGFILMNDYGPTKLADADDFQHQRYSGSTFVGTNFALLRDYFDETQGHCWVEPDEDCGRKTHARLLGRNPASETIVAFQERFDRTTWEGLREPEERARQMAQAGETEAALAAYRQALERQPYNWVLVDEVARWLTSVLEDPAAGAEMARAALSLNPGCSAGLWNTLGDSLLALGHIGEARKAYLRALEVNADDVEARYKLAEVCARSGLFAQALTWVGQGLARDSRGQFREGLLRVQAEVLDEMACRQQQEEQRLAARVRHVDGGTEGVEPPVRFAPAEKPSQTMAN